MSGEGSGTTFDQSGQTVRTQTNVGSVAGDFNIGAQTSKADMGRTIAGPKAEIASLKGLPPEVRKQLDEALDDAASVTPSPKHSQVKANLDRAANALAGAAAQLEGADDFAQKALKLAKTVFSIGKWVIATVAL